MQFTDLPQDVLSKILQELPIELLSPFLQSRFTRGEAYRQIYSKQSAKIEVGSPSFSKNHFNFGMYAHEEEDVNYYVRSADDLNSVGNRNVLKQISRIYFEADLNCGDFTSYVTKLKELLEFSSPKILQVHTSVNSQAALDQILSGVQQICSSPGLKISLKLEINAEFVPSFFQRIEVVPVSSINILIHGICELLDLPHILLNLHSSTEMLKLKSLHRVMNLNILSNSLLWLEIDMPMNENIGFLQTLNEYQNLAELRLFQIDNSFDKDFFFNFEYPSTLKKLYLHFGNKANALNVTNIHRVNPHIEYLYISDNKSTIMYRK